MDESTAARLRVIHEDALLEKAAKEGRAAGPYSCMKCGAGIRKPRFIKEAGKRHVSMSFCDQACFDAWASQFKLRGVAYPWYGEDGIQKGFYIPKKGYVPFDVDGGDA